MSTRLSDYRFVLPDAQIARRPLDVRSSSRLLVLPTEGPPAHHTFRDLATLLAPGDRLVVNDTRVIPARLNAEKAGTGGKVEVLLCRAGDDGEWIVLLNPGRKIHEGLRLVFGVDEGPEPFFGEVIGRQPHEPGAWRMRFEGNPLAFAQMRGHVPIPPYFGRDDDDEDAHRYQTVYAHPDKPGSAAAPTAGLHFDDTLLDALAARGIDLTRVTLHVGPGTFLPVRMDDVTEHEMHPEPWTVSEDAAREIASTRAQGGRIVAVGTTALRTLETAVDEQGHVRAGSGLTRLFIYPGYQFRATDLLVTNFHLPESSLLMLVAAFVGRDRLLAAYQDAIDDGYRFYSYGDSSLLYRAS